MAADFVKRGALGAIWVGKLDKVPSSHCKVKWEVEFQRTPPASVRPLKPKVWLMHPVTLDADIYYELA